MVRIGIDIMGGDFSPLEAIKGVNQFIQSNQLSKDCEIHLIGEKEKSGQIMEQENVLSKPNIVFHASENSVTFEDSPSKVFREKPNSSIGIGFKMMEEGNIDAFISAGNTGAMLVGAQTILKPVKNVSRLAIGVSIPLPSYPGIMLDVGSNIDCKPELLNQFALLGSVFMKSVHNIDRPTVGLLNVGEEKNKGNTACIEAHQLLSKNSKINFIGNIEGRDIFGRKANVIVCDGFVGNVIIKLLESLYDELLDRLHSHENESVKKNLQIFNFETHGGTPILGINKPVLIGHGISSANAFTKMIESAHQLVVSQFCQKLEQTFAQE